MILVILVTVLLGLLVYYNYVLSLYPLLWLLLGVFSLLSIDAWVLTQGFIKGYLKSTDLSF